MSINKFQEKVFRTGCGSAVLYVCAAVFFAGMFYMGCGMGNSSNGGDNSNKKVAVTVGNSPIYAPDLQQQITALRDQEMQQQQMQQNLGSSPDTYPPLSEAQMEASVIKRAVTDVAIDYLARKDGVNFTNEAIAAAAKDQFNEEILMQKGQFMQQQTGKKPDLSDKAFDVYLKSHYGAVQKDLFSTFLKNLDAKLKDDKSRPTVETQFARPLLEKLLQSQIKPTDAELKANYDTYVFKRIIFGADAGAKVADQIAKAQADLKGGLTFEQAMDRYSKESPLRTKTVSDNITEKSMAEMTGNPAYAPLAALKPGLVSDVVDDPAGKAMYKLMSIRSNLPADFDKQKAKYVDEYTKPKADAKLDKELKDLLGSSAVKWDSAGYKAIFDWDQAHSDFTPGANISAKMADVVTEAKKAVTKNSGYDARSALLAWYVAFDSIWNAPGADKAKLRGDRIEVSRAMVQDTPYFSIKMELVDLLTQAKQGPEAVDMLKDAASTNVYYDSEGFRDFQRINAKMGDLKKAGILNAAGTVAIQAIQDAWVKQNQEVEQEKAQDKAAKDAAQKAADELKAKQLAEQAKAKASEATKNPSQAPSKPGESQAKPPVTGDGMTPNDAPKPTPQNKPPVDKTTGSTAGKKQ